MLLVVIIYPPLDLDGQQSLVAAAAPASRLLASKGDAYLQTCEAAVRRWTAPRRRTGTCMQL